MLETLGRGLVKTANTFASTIYGSVGAVAGPVYSLFDSEPVVAGNDIFSRTSRSLAEIDRQTNPIYDIDPYQFEATDLFRIAPSAVGSGLGFLVPGTAVAKGIGLLGAGVTAIARARQLTQVGQVLGRVATNPVVQLVGQQTTSGIAMRHMEAYMEASNLYQDIKKQLTANPSLISPEARQRIGQELIADGIPVTDEALVEYLAGEGAVKAYQLNYSNLLFDILQMGTLVRRFGRTGDGLLDDVVDAAHKRFRTGQDVSDHLFAGSLSDARKQLAKSMRLTSIREATLGPFSEGIEELVNNAAQQTGALHAYQLATKGKSDASFFDNFGGESSVESFVGGLLGGIAFGAPAIRDAVSHPARFQQEADQREEATRSYLTRLKKQQELTEQYWKDVNDIVNNPNLSTEQRDLALDTLKATHSYAIAGLAIENNNLPFIKRFIASSDFDNVSRLILAQQSGTAPSENTPVSLNTQVSPSTSTPPVSPTISTFLNTPTPTSTNTPVSPNTTAPKLLSIIEDELKKLRTHLTREINTAEKITREAKLEGNRIPNPELRTAYISTKYNLHTKRSAMQMYLDRNQKLLEKARQDSSIPSEVLDSPEVQLFAKSFAQQLLLDDLTALEAPNDTQHELSRKFQDKYVTPHYKAQVEALTKQLASLEEAVKEAKQNIQKLENDLNEYESKPPRDQVKEHLAAKVEALEKAKAKQRVLDQFVDGILQGNRSDFVIALATQFHTKTILESLNDAIRNLTPRNFLDFINDTKKEVDQKIKEQKAQQQAQAQEQAQSAVPPLDETAQASQFAEAQAQSTLGQAESNPSVEAEAPVESVALDEEAIENEPVPTDVVQTQPVEDPKPALPPQVAPTTPESHTQQQPSTETTVPFVPISIPSWHFTNNDTNFNQVYPTLAVTKLTQEIVSTLRKLQTLTPGKTVTITKDENGDFLVSWSHKNKKQVLVYKVGTPQHSEIGKHFKPGVAKLTRKLTHSDVLLPVSLVGGPIDQPITIRQLLLAYDLDDLGYKVVPVTDDKALVGTSDIEPTGGRVQHASDPNLLFGVKSATFRAMRAKSGIRNEAYAYLVAPDGSKTLVIYEDLQGKPLTLEALAELNYSAITGGIKLPQNFPLERLVGEASTLPVTHTISFGIHITNFKPVYETSAQPTPPPTAAQRQTTEEIKVQSPATDGAQSPVVEPSLGTKEMPTHSMKPINRKRAIRWWTNRFPNVPFEVVENVLSYGGQAAWGLFKDGAVQVYKGAPDKTTYHEAFHVVMRMSLPEATYKRLIAQARKQYNLVNSTDQEVEEYLADLFEEYEATRQSAGLFKQLLRFFEKLIAWIRDVVLNPDYDSIPLLFSGLSNAVPSLKRTDRMDSFYAKHASSSAPKLIEGLTPKQDTQFIRETSDQIVYYTHLINTAREGSVTDAGLAAYNQLRKLLLEYQKNRESVQDPQLALNKPALEISNIGQTMQFLASPFSDLTSPEIVDSQTSDDDEREDAPVEEASEVWQEVVKQELEAETEEQGPSRPYIEQVVQALVWNSLYKKYLEVKGSNPDLASQLEAVLGSYTRARNLGYMNPFDRSFQEVLTRFNVENLEDFLVNDDEMEKDWDGAFDKLSLTRSMSKDLKRLIKLLPEKMLTSSLSPADAVYVPTTYYPKDSVSYLNFEDAYATLESTLIGLVTWDDMRRQLQALGQVRPGFLELVATLDDNSILRDKFVYFFDKQLQKKIVVFVSPSRIYTGSSKFSNESVQYIYNTIQSNLDSFGLDYILGIRKPLNYAAIYQLPYEKLLDAITKFITETGLALKIQGVDDNGNFVYHNLTRKALDLHFSKNQMPSITEEQKREAAVEYLKTFVGSTLSFTTTEFYMAKGYSGRNAAYREAYATMTPEQIREDKALYIKLLLTKQTGRLPAAIQPFIPFANLFKSNQEKNVDGEPYYAAAVSNYLSDLAKLFDKIDDSKMEAIRLLASRHVAAVRAGNKASPYYHDAFFEQLVKYSPDGSWYVNYELLEQNQVSLNPIDGIKQLGPSFGKRPTGRKISSLLFKDEYDKYEITLFYRGGKNNSVRITTQAHADSPSYWVFNVPRLNGIVSVAELSTKKHLLLKEVQDQLKDGVELFKNEVIKDLQYEKARISQQLRIYKMLHVGSPKNVGLVIPDLFETGPGGTVNYGEFSGDIKTALDNIARINIAYRQKMNRDDDLLIEHRDFKIDVANNKVRAGNNLKFVTYEHLPSIQQLEVVNGTYREDVNWDVVFENAAKEFLVETGASVDTNDMEELFKRLGLYTPTFEYNQIPKSLVYRLIRLEFRYHQFVYRRTLDTLTLGHTSQYKSLIDKNKRAKTIVSPTQKGINEHDTVNTILIQDIELEMSKDAIEKGLGKPGDTINAADAQVWVTPRFLERFLRNQGRWERSWDSPNNPVYKLFNGKELTPKELYQLNKLGFFTPIKPFYVEQKYNPSRQDSYLRNAKLSMSIIWPQLHSFKTRNELANLMDGDKPVDIIMPSSAAKFGWGTYSTLFDKEGKLLPEDQRNIRSFPTSMKYWGVQMTVPSEVENETNKLSAQLRKVAIANLDAEAHYKVNVNGKPTVMQGEELQEAYHMLLASMYQDNLEVLKKELFTEEGDRIDVDKLMDYLESELRKKAIDRSVEESLYSGAFFDFPAFGDRPEAFLSSLVQRKGIDLRTPGYSAVAVSSIGFDIDPKDFRNDGLSHKQDVSLDPEWLAKWKPAGPDLSNKNEIDLTKVNPNPYASKDQRKSSKANKAIIHPKSVKSSKLYLDAWKAIGKANVGQYEATDMVFVSVNGNTAGRAPVYKEELMKAIEARADFIADGPSSRNREYNVGEREFAKLMAENDYVELASKDGQVAIFHHRDKYSAKKETPKLGWAKLHTTADGNDIYIVEALVPAFSSALYRRNKSLIAFKHITNKDDLLHIAFRLPNEGKYSTFIVKPVGILGPAYGPSIVVADEIITQTGMDFDVDKLYTHTRNLVNKNGKVYAIPSSMTTTSLANTNKGRRLAEKQRHNQLLDFYLTLFGAPNHFDETHSTSSFNKMKEYNKGLSQSAKKAHPVNLNTQLLEDGAQGKKLIGIAANILSTFGIAQALNLNLTSREGTRVNWSYDNKYVKHDKNQGLIIDSLKEFVAAVLDMSKDPQITIWGGNTITVPLGMFMISSGAFTLDETLALLGSPMVNQYTQVMLAVEKSNFLDIDLGALTETEQEDIASEKRKKYDRDLKTSEKPNFPELLKLLIETSDKPITLHNYAALITDEFKSRFKPDRSIATSSMGSKLLGERWDLRDPSFTWKNTIPPHKEVEDDHPNGLQFNVEALKQIRAENKHYFDLSVDELRECTRAAVIVGHIFDMFTYWQKNLVLIMKLDALDYDGFRSTNKVTRMLDNIIEPEHEENNLGKKLIETQEKIPAVALMLKNILNIYSTMEKALSPFFVLKHQVAPSKFKEQMIQVLRGSFQYLSIDTYAKREPEDALITLIKDYYEHEEWINLPFVTKLRYYKQRPEYQGNDFFNYLIFGNKASANEERNQTVPTVEGNPRASRDDRDAAYYAATRLYHEAEANKDLNLAYFLEEAILYEFENHGFKYGGKSYVRSLLGIMNQLGITKAENFTSGFETKQLNITFENDSTLLHKWMQLFNPENDNHLPMSASNDADICI